MWLYNSGMPILVADGLIILLPRQEHAEFDEMLNIADMGYLVDSLSVSSYTRWAVT